MDQRHKRKGGGWQRRMKQKAAENPLLRRPRGMNRPPLEEREIRFHRFKEALGETRFANFLAHTRKECGIGACVRLSKELDEGKSLLGLVLTEKKWGYAFGFRKFAWDRWFLCFGYFDSPLSGDCGEWVVKFHESGEIAEIRLLRCWQS